MNKEVDTINYSFYKKMSEKIDRTQLNHSVCPKGLSVLKQYISNTKSKQKVFRYGKLTDIEKNILRDRKETIQELTNNYIPKDDIFVSNIPQNQFFKEIEDALDSLSKSSNLSKYEVLILNLQVKKAKAVHNLFQGSGWTPWKKFLYLSRVRILMSFFHRFLTGNTRSKVRREKLKAILKRKNSQPIGNMVNTTIIQIKEM